MLQCKTVIKRVLVLAMVLFITRLTAASTMDRWQLDSQTDGIKIFISQKLHITLNKW